ncbi:class I SAM-dependent methyltransferase [Rhodovulum sp. DZ06]|uniref:class I SAM-dependent methyltransferase n=1 Tax=Rhodovulum sp. DZ06 TaxID=3425126 RepID=UPI003D324896
MTSSARMAARRVLRALRPARTVRHCPICGWRGARFDTGGTAAKQRIDARCPGCGGFERHRLAYHVAETAAELDFSRVLHVAPERELSKWLRGKAAEYLSIDLYNEAMAKMDVTDLELEDGSYTLFWASHVLEHVPEDRKAIAEIHRVLAPGGKAVIQVPIWRLKTFEDPSATTPERRLELFYQDDHVRLYGLDIMERFEAQGFRAEVVRAQDFGPETLLTLGLSFASTDEVFIFTK